MQVGNVVRLEDAKGYDDPPDELVSAPNEVEEKVLSSTYQLFMMTKKPAVTNTVEDKHQSERGQNMELLLGMETYRTARPPNLHLAVCPRWLLPCRQPLHCIPDFAPSSCPTRVDLGRHVVLLSIQVRVLNSLLIPHLQMLKNHALG